MGLLNTRCIRVKPAFAGLIFFKVCHHRICALFTKLSHQLSFCYPISGISTDFGILIGRFNENFRFTPIFVTSEPLFKEVAKLFPLTLGKRYRKVRTQGGHMMIQVGDMAKIKIMVANFPHGGI